MKFVSLATTAIAFALPAFAQSTESLSYDPVYDNASLPLTAVACSNGSYGLITRGYTTLGSLPTFPNLGGVYTITGFNSPSCGTCYNVTYTNPSSGTNNTLTVLGIDVGADGFNLSEEAMNALTNGNAVGYGRVPVTSVQVNASVCGL